MRFLIEGNIMNILFYRYNSICEPDIIDVLRNMGHHVEEITED